MNSNRTHTNQSFETISNSSIFLNKIIHEITSCVLLLNQKMELVAYNDPIKTIFCNKKDEHLLYQRCGEAIGCAFSIDEMERCGETSKCRFCELRESALFTYSNKEDVFKQRISREFYTTERSKVIKHLEFSTRHFEMGTALYIILIINDNTDLINAKYELEAKKK